MKRKIAVLGVGAIGSSIGADLTQAGLDVTLIDQWPAHVKAMKANGLKVQFRDSQFQVPVKALNLCEMASAGDLCFDLVFLAAKSNDHRWLAEFIKPRLKRGELSAVSTRATPRSGEIRQRRRRTGA